MKQSGSGWSAKKKKASERDVPVGMRRQVIQIDRVTLHKKRKKKKGGKTYQVSPYMGW